MNEYQSTIDGDTCTVHLPKDGVQDYEYDRLRSFFDGILEEGVNHVVVNFNGGAHKSHIVLPALRVLSREVEAREGSLQLRDTPAAMVGMIRLMKLDELMKVVSQETRKPKRGNLHKV